jgi:hypothetical protein
VPGLSGADLTRCVTLMRIPVPAVKGSMMFNGALIMESLKVGTRLRDLNIKQPPLAAGPLTNRRSGCEERC